MGAGGERHDLEDDVRELRELMELGELGEHYLATTDHLKPGMRLRTSAGIWTQITAVHAYVKTGHVYNLTIAELHTYYVEVGTTSVLVHNADGLCISGLHKEGDPECGCVDYGPPVWKPEGDKTLDEFQKAHGAL